MTGDLKRKRKSKPNSLADQPKKKKKLLKAEHVERTPQDYAAQFADDMATLRMEEKLPNSSLQQVYDSLTGRLLRLDGSGAAQQAAADVTRGVLTSQDGRQLFRILSPTSTAGQAQAALRLLTACVSSGAAAARVMLAEFRFEHGRLPQVAALKNLNATTDVRVAFVTFVLSFLIDSDRLVIQDLLDKKIPMSVVCTGLVTDRSSTIHLVLSTWKEAVLENPKISKKTKLRLFNARHLTALLGLYRWRGHQLTWRSRTNLYKKKNKPNADDDESNPADPAELHQVRQNVHEFLMLLATSHAHGIVFKDASVGTSGVNCNPVLLEMLRSMTSPWRDQLTAELVVATITACPDICQHYLPSLESQLSPRPSAEWHAAVAMVTAGVSRCRLVLPAGGETRLMPEAVCRAAAACCYPPAAREVMRSGVSHEDGSVRQASLSLLVAVLDQVRSLQSRLADSPDYGPAARSALADDVTPHLPTCDQLTGVWSQLTAAKGTPPPAQLLLVLRALSGCWLVATRWSTDGSTLARIQAQLSTLGLDDDQLRQLASALDPIAAGLKSELSGPSRDKLRLSDVPGILAAIRGDAQPPDDSDSAPETPTAAPPPGGVPAPAPAPAPTAGPTLAGDSPRARLTSLVAMATPRMRRTRPPLDELRALCAQLSGDLGDDLDGDPVEGWAEFVKQALKRGLQEPPLGAIVVPTLTRLVRAGLFPCRGATSAGRDEDVSAELLYELVLSHSTFLERMLDPAEDELPLRDAILEMLLATVTRCRHVCKSSHVAPFLAAYGATLSDTDQLILQLISRYEMAGVSLHAYQPMVWGSAALNFYNPTQGGGLSLKSQPKAGDVISLLEVDKMAATCRRMPLKISLKLETLPCDPAAYDPRFLLSVLCQLTAPEQPCDPLQVIACGALSLLLCLLSCRQAAVRAAAWAVISRLHLQLQGSRHARLKLIWLTFIDVLRASVTPDQRVPFVVTHTWARLVMILHEPGHKLFQQVSRYLLRQASSGQLQLTRVPLFFELFNSRSALDHRAEHEWMVAHLCQSVHQMSDYGVLQRTVTYKLAMSLAGCCLATARPLLIKLLEVTARMPRALLDLDYRHGLLAWLCGHVTRLSGEAATRAALASLAVQMALTLRGHLASGRAGRPAALLDGLQTFVTLLARAVHEDPVLRAKVARCRADVRELGRLGAKESEQT